MGKTSTSILGLENSRKVRALSAHQYEFKFEFLALNDRQIESMAGVWTMEQSYIKSEDKLQKMVHKFVCHGKPVWIAYTNARTVTVSINFYIQNYHFCWIDWTLINCSELCFVIIENVTRCLIWFHKLRSMRWGRYRELANFLKKFISFFIENKSRNRKWTIFCKWSDGWDMDGCIATKSLTCFIIIQQK